MLLKIQTVSEGKDSKKPYAKTLLGKLMFAAPGVKLETGKWAVTTTQRQTKRNAIIEGKKVLVDIPSEDQPVLNMVQALFTTKEEAVSAIMDENSGDAAVITAMQVVDENFTLADLRKLEGAGV